MSQGKKGSFPGKIRLLLQEHQKTNSQETGAKGSCVKETL
jgi:hypothetical protein